MVVLCVDVETERALAEALLDDGIEPDKGATADEKDIGRVDLEWAKLDGAITTLRTSRRQRHI